MSLKQPPRLLDEICTKANLEDFRNILSILLQDIHESGCRVCIQDIDGHNNIEWYHPDNPLIRIGIPHPEKKLNLIWALLHEYGHFLSSRPKPTDTTLDREYLAWQKADHLMTKYPSLLNHKASYDIHRQECIVSYEKELLGRKQPEL